MLVAGEVDLQLAAAVAGSVPLPTADKTQNDAFSLIRIRRLDEPAVCVKISIHLVAQAGFHDAVESLKSKREATKHADETSDEEHTSGTLGVLTRTPPQFWRCAKSCREAQPRAGLCGVRARLSATTRAVAVWPVCAACRAAVALRCSAHANGALHGLRDAGAARRTGYSERTQSACGGSAAVAVR